MEIFFALCRRCSVQPNTAAVMTAVRVERPAIVAFLPPAAQFVTRSVVNMGARFNG
ncbi:hypothetical protein [Aquincola tertiaricarbonis]|uniref:hypothetical protein n=1 Tax=Aquincola tertiaricarbonis TaxID=391953 RepID=UPI0012EDABBA|nr:hypothetical protein [Aquincola tertiaricarbonis]